eukprot:GHVQ01019259.1.p1 GENE.GHVQ01019259.1~~GHVQ01019259.1.p1  ORF type:complete len:175 (+),score=21.84 GHVQ01019259.1:237-761(+)
MQGTYCLNSRLFFFVAVLYAVSALVATSDPSSVHTFAGDSEVDYESNTLTRTVIPKATASVTPGTSLIDRIQRVLADVLPLEYDPKPLVEAIQTAGGIPELGQKFVEATNNPGTAESNLFRTEIIAVVEKELKKIGEYLGLGENDVDGQFVRDLAFDLELEGNYIDVISAHFDK